MFRNKKNYFGTKNNYWTLYDGLTGRSPATPNTYEYKCTGFVAGRKAHKPLDNLGLQGPVMILLGGERTAWSLPTYSLYTAQFDD